MALCEQIILLRCAPQNARVTNPGHIRVWRLAGFNYQTPLVIELNRINLLVFDETTEVILAWMQQRTTPKS
ncbi:MAG: hypothetical protein ACKV2V_02960 [Blastocatellia bacterium]